MPVVTKIGTVLHAALKDHIAKFNLLTGSYLEFKKFVTAFLEVYRGHNY